MGREVDVVHDDHDRAPKLVARATKLFHHLHAVLHVEVVEWFIEQQIFGVLREHHRDVCALALASRKLVEKAILERREVYEVDRFGHDSLVSDGEPATRIREATKSDELAHREASDEVIVLAEDREHR